MQQPHDRYQNGWLFKGPFCPWSRNHVPRVLCATISGCKHMRILPEREDKSVCWTCVCILYTLSLSENWKKKKNGFLWLIIVIIVVILWQYLGRELVIGQPYCTQIYVNPFGTKCSVCNIVDGHFSVVSVRRVPLYCLLSLLWTINFCMFNENGNIFSLSVADWLFHYIAHHTNTAHTSSSYGMAPIKNERNKKET